MVSAASLLDHYVTNKQRPSYLNTVAGGNSSSQRTTTTATVKAVQNITTTTTTTMRTATMKAAKLFQANNDRIIINRCLLSHFHARFLGRVLDRMAIADFSIATASYSSNRIQSISISKWLWFHCIHFVVCMPFSLTNGSV